MGERIEMLEKKTRYKQQRLAKRGIYKLTSQDEFFLGSIIDFERSLLLTTSNELNRLITSSAPLPFAGFVVRDELDAKIEGYDVVLHDLENPDVAAPGDVVLVDPRSQWLTISFRRGSNSNSLFVTEQCNSYCVMCSQPPIRKDDEWRLSELKKIVELVDPDEQLLGLTGGEPTIFGEAFVDLLDYCVTTLPKTSFHCLTNGKSFSDRRFARSCAEAGKGRVLWGIPLYSFNPETHDFIVQDRLAFSRTVAGLYNLGREQQSIELRFVLQKHNISHLPSFADFVARNLPFVQQVAFMGLEPMGFARTNWQDIYVEPFDYATDLEAAISILSDAGIEPLIYNVPLCFIPEKLWEKSCKSISDWKNIYLDGCESCEVKARCCGFFKSVDTARVSSEIRPFQRITIREED